MRGVHVVAVGMIPFGKYPEQGVKGLAAMVMTNLRDDSPISLDEIEAVWMGNAGWGMNTGQHCIRGQVALAPLGIGGIPVMNVENACAGASSALHGAYLGVAAGAYDIALAIGVEKMTPPGSETPEEKARRFESFLAGTDVEVTRQLIEQMKAHADAKRAELTANGQVAAEGSAARSPFMDIYSMASRLHMDRYGTTQEQLAVIASKNHFHGSLNPDAQYRMPMTVGEVLDDRLVSYPLTRAMCAPTGDGAAAAILVSEERLGDLDAARPVRIRASVLRSAGTKGENEASTAARKAYEMAGVGPEDIDTAEVHDATAFGELAQTESLGFCPEGEGGPYAESGATTLGGSKPVNPSGGLECRGHPLGATGLAQAAEIVRQLRGEAGERQVAGARLGLTENGGGFLGMGEAAIAVHIFEGPPT
ncbi:MAG: thiolase family protein [Acidimicrobiia bacterium]|nr:thiolase family protein [Acidimicrobiia bacterium]